MHICVRKGIAAKDDQVRILDFGVGALLAQGEEESLVDTRSTANVLASGLDCVSPESILDPNQRTAAGDQYSLGCVLYFCLAGRLPFEGTAAEKLQAHRAKPPDPIRNHNPAVPETLAAILERLMQKEPSARYADMSELIAALRPIAEPTSASPAPIELPAELSPAVGSPGVASQAPPATEVPPRKHAIPTPPELSATPFVPAAVALAPKNDEPGDILTPTQAVPSLSDADVDSRRKQATPTPRVTAPLPAGATQVLGRASARKPSDYSVFDLPAVNDPRLPRIMPSPGKVAAPSSSAPVEQPPKTSIPKLQPPSSPEGPIPVPDDVSGRSAPHPIQQSSETPLSLEERLGSRTMLILALFAAVIVFLVGYLLFPH